MKKKEDKEWQISMDLENEGLQDKMDSLNIQNSEDNAVTAKEYAEKYRRYFHNAADLIALLDPNGVLLEVNKRFERESGYTEEEIIGKNVGELEILTKDASKIIKSFLKKIVTGDFSPMFEVEGIKKDGSVVPYEIRAVAIRENNKTVAIQANIRNISERKKVEKTLGEREEYYQTLFQLSPSGILLEDHKGVILDVNPAFCHTLGYEREDLIGQNVRVIAHPDEADLVESNLHRLLKGEILKHVVKSRRKDGSYCFMELNEKKYTLPNGDNGILCVSQDISDRKQSEEELLYKTKFQENLLKTARHLTRSLDIKEVLNEIASGIMEILNTKSCALYLLEQNLKSLRPVVTIDPDYRDEVLKMPLDVDKSFTGSAVKKKRGLIFNDTGPDSMGQQIPGTPEEKEERIMVAPFLIEEKVIGAMCLSRMKINFTDEELSLAETFASFAAAALKNAQLYHNLQKEVEERKNVQDRINELNLQYDHFIKNSLVGIWRIEFEKPLPISINKREIARSILEHAVISDCNDALSQMYGFPSREEILGKYPREFILDYDLSTDRMEKFVENNFKTEMIETQEKDNKGKSHHFRNSYFGVIKENQLHAIWGIQMDITDRKRLEEQLRQSQKLEAIGTLAGGIAHDFNNLLTVINGHAEMSMMTLEGEHPAHRDIISILSAGKRAKNLTSQLLAFSRKQIYAPRIIEINRVITSLDKMLRRIIGEDINIEKNLRSDIPLIEADPGQIEQILMNLIVNARDAINIKTDKAAEKKILIETAYMNLDDSFVAKHTGSSKGPHIVLTVSDTGIGIDVNIRDKIFEPFFTTKEKGLGTGLGLSTVYGIVKQNKGSIYVFSEAGFGTTIKIYWPASEENRASEETQILPKVALLGTESILVVEDDEGVRNFISTALKGLGYKITEAINGKKAIDLLKKDEIKIDLVITDLVMPEMNGKELAVEIEKILPGTRILFTSGYTEDHIVSSGSLDKGINFLQKPYTMQALAKKIREVFGSVSV